MVAVLLSLVSAVSYGGSDYAAGLAARGSEVLRVTLAVQLTYAVLVTSAVPFLTRDSATASALAWGAAAGASSVAAAMALYLGFRHAAFSVVSSVSAVASAVFSVLAGLLFGERPTLTSLAGIAVALPAIAAVAAGPSQASAVVADRTDAVRARRPVPSGPAAGRHHGGGSQAAAVARGLVAGAGFGLFFICLHQAGPGGDLWPIAAAALGGLVIVVIAAAVTRQLRPPQPGARWLSALSGATAAAGTYAYFLATHRGLLAVTAVITSLSPAGTVVLARLLIGERLSRTRIAGLCLAAVSVSLIAAAGTG